jgi:hypothetical protein
MDKSWWKPFPPSSSKYPPPKPPALHEEKNIGEQIFFVAGDDGGSVMTGMSQQELLRKKARSESKNRSKLFGKRKKKKNPIVSLPPGLLGGNRKESTERAKFYSSSSLPSSTSSPKRIIVKRNKPPTTAATKTLDTVPQSSGNTWKTQWMGDEKASDTTADSTYTDSLPTVPKSPSLETPFSAVPPPWTAVHENEGDLFMNGKEPHEKADENWSIDEYSFPLLSTGALGGITEDAIQAHNKANAKEAPEVLESIPEIQERASAISASRSDASSRVRFSSTAELSTVGTDSDGMPLVDKDDAGASELYTSTYMSYMIDLDSPSPVAHILNRSGSHIATPTKRRRKSRNELSPVRSILRPARYGDRNGRVVGVRKKAYVRAMSFLRASQILRNGMDSYEDEELVLSPEEEPEFVGVSWVPAVKEEGSDHLNFVDPSGAELSPIREARSSSVSDALSKSEDWSEFEESETMQRLNFIEAVAAVVIQTGYRRHMATKWVNALRHEAEISKYEQMYVQEQERKAREQHSPQLKSDSMGDPGTVDTYSRHLEMQSSSQGEQAPCPGYPSNGSPREAIYFDHDVSPSVDEVAPRVVRDHALLDQELLTDTRTERVPDIAPKQLQKEFGESPKKSEFHEYATRTQLSPDPNASPQDDHAGAFPAMARATHRGIDNVHPRPASPDTPMDESQADIAAETEIDQVSGQLTEKTERETAREMVSFADTASMSEITMEKEIRLVEEPKRRSVSGYIHDIEASAAQNGSVLDQVVHMGNQSVRILASSGYRETPAYSSPHWSGKTVDRSAKPPPTAQARDNVVSRGKVECKGVAEGAVIGQSRPPALPVPQRRLGKKENDSSRPTHASTQTSQEEGSARAAVKIQSVFRGFWARDCLNVDHYCAMVIQKAFRGYLCRANYQYNRYRIIVVQSVWRRSIARSDVAHVLACTILIQSLIRGYLVRQRKKAASAELTARQSRSAAALTIQCSWRRYSAESYLIRQLVDVLICQSVVRGWLSRQALRKRKAARLKSGDNNFNLASQESPESSASSSESSIPETPPRVLARVTKTRSALAPPWSPSSGMSKSPEHGNESEPGQIPTSKRVSSPRDGRPPIAPVRPKSSRHAEQYEYGLRIAEKEVQAKKNAPIGSGQKVQVIPPVDDVLGAGLDKSLASDGAVDCYSGGDGSGAPTLLVKDETETVEEDSFESDNGIPAEIQPKNVDEALRSINELPDDNPYKDYYRIWAARGLLRPMRRGNTDTNTREVSEAIESPEDPLSVPSPCVDVKSSTSAACGTEQSVELKASDSEEIQQEIPFVPPCAEEGDLNCLDSAQESGIMEAHSSEGDTSDLSRDKDVSKQPSANSADSLCTTHGGFAGIFSSNAEEGDGGPQLGSVSSIISRMNQRVVTSKHSIPSTGKSQQKQKPDTAAQPSWVNKVNVKTSEITESGTISRCEDSLLETSRPKEEVSTNREGNEGSATRPFSSVIEGLEVPRKDSETVYVGNESGRQDCSPVQSNAAVLSHGVASNQDADPNVEEGRSNPSSETGTKSVVVYPEGFASKTSRRRANERSLRCTSSEEKKESDSVAGADREEHLEDSVRPSEDEEKTLSATTIPESKAETKGNIANVEVKEKVVPIDDPNFSAYEFWHRKGLLSWKPVSQPN